MFDMIFGFVETIVLQNVGQLVPIFMATISPLIGSCVALHALWLAYKALYEPDNMMIMESLKTIGSLALCATIAFSAPWYISSIVPIVYFSGDDIASILLGAESIGAMLDNVTDLFVNRIEFIYNNIDVEFLEGETWKAMFLSVLMILILLVGFIPFLVVSTLYLTGAKLMVGFLLIIGPLFIMFAFFPSTRSMFQSWTGLCLNYTLLIVVYSLGFSLLIQLIEIATPDELSLKSSVLTLVLMAVCSGISVQIPSFCSSLSGGVGINGLVSNMGAGMRGLRSGAGTVAKYSGANAAGRFTGKLAGKGARAAANKAIDKVQSNIKPG